MSETEKGDAAPLQDKVSAAPAPQLPATQAQAEVRPENAPAIVEHKPASKTAIWTRRLAILALIGGGAGYLFWQAHRAPAIPAWIVYGNGRLEADPIDIAAKFAGRIAQLRADEGDKVVAGQVVAVMDVRDMEQSLKRGEAQVDQAQKLIDEARANLVQSQSAALLAQQQLARTENLLKSGYATHELLDQRRQALDAARAAQAAAEHRIGEAEKALIAARHDAELTRVNIADNTLVAPRDGRIEYRIANIGEVLPAGGKVFTMLDTSYVYMDVYLPTLAADKVKIGSDARIVVDAYPDRPIPAKVSFLAERAQFTPKMVETKHDRDKLMFRVRVRIDPARSKAHADSVRSGLPGAAYIKTDPDAAWTPALQGQTGAGPEAGQGKKE
ncbi:HlyD family efflux transporter periplasmic adaptor subunit [uncultured Rhodoblastus sp.]|uniref:HlyD family secretion protein n=1 Tax=uncultured Rhodoblastus sp. TaxID=543037 RepID=UPI0025DBB74A|nr:HlyD family efflux transporter periplasmic adaptor subunit [uncultured Rhodoblastus sp.]